MVKRVISARGEVVDFDLLAIKQQLATNPVPVSVDERRKFIDTKDGIKTKTVASVPDALKVAAEAAQVSEASIDADADEQ